MLKNFLKILKLFGGSMRKILWRLLENMWKVRKISKIHATTYMKYTMRFKENKREVWKNVEENSELV